MSFGMIDTEVRQQMHEVRRQSARGRAPEPALSGGSPGTHSPGAAVQQDRRSRSGLRSRIGFTLVETGLRLLTSGQAHG
jgi:hypothetical protein